MYLIELRKSGFPASPTNADSYDVINGGDISSEDEDREEKDGDKMDDLQAWYSLGESIWPFDEPPPVLSPGLFLAWRWG